ncbi:MAG: hypothetical protein GDA48_21395 [Hormoscilla sp. GM102CHS1]|nr:hypothetical protein [Hormoscilla sp. GM102CHS1]
MELIAVGLIFVLGFMSLLAAFLPPKIWGKLPIIGMLYGIIFYVVTSGIAYQFSDQNIWAATLPIIGVATCYATIVVLDRFSNDLVLGYCYGLASPFIISVLITTTMKKNEWTEGFLWLSTIIVMTFLLIGWTKMKEKMIDDKFKHYQIFLSMISVCLVGVATGIAVMYIYFLSTGSDS